MLKRLFPRSLLHRLRLVRGPEMLAERWPQYEIGQDSYGDLAITDFGEGTRFSMGAYCSVAKGCRVLLGGGHRLDWVTTYPFSVHEAELMHVAGHPVSRGDVKIGNDVWLASNVTILSGVTIGDGAVVMAGAIVSRDVEPYSIVGGIPARETGKRFDDATIKRLLAVRWWDWDKARIVAAGEFLLSDDIERFLEKAEAGEI